VALALLQENPLRQIAEIVHAVSAESEWTGALVLAEGIELEEHRETALALGREIRAGLTVRAACGASWPPL
jgi:EAL domain-containing protein (putative c-di-GMP-specific phosphodiesterase class I)